MLALHGAAILYTNVPLDLDRGRWLLVRFPAPAHEVAPQLLALVAPLPPVETFRRNVSTVDPEGDPHA